MSPASEESPSLPADAPPRVPDRATAAATAAGAPAKPPSKARPTLNESVETLVALAHRAGSPQSFLRSALATIAQAVGAGVGALEVRILSTVVTEMHAENEALRAFWDNTVERALTDALGDSRPRARMYASKAHGTTLALINAPLRGPEQRATGALVVLAPCPTRDDAARLLDMLASLAFLTATLVETLGEKRASKEQAGNDALSNLRKVANFHSTTELAFALTNKLRTRDGCDTVALAQVIGTQAHILAISGLDEVTPRSPGVRCIQASMEECLDLGRPVVQQDGDRIPGVVSGAPLHERWRTQAKGAPVASIPLVLDADTVAILSVRRSPHATFSSDDLEEFEKLVGPYAATLQLVERASRTLPRHARLVLQATLRDLLGRGQLGLKAAIAAPILLALWLVFGSLTYEVTMPCTLQAADARQVGMPNDGLLEHLYVLPGDRVKAGDVLCQFDVTDLALERDRLLGELSILQIEEGRAMADDDPAAIQLARANRANVRASLELVQHRIDAAKVRAPATGTVTVGDLRERIGDIFSKGEPLFEIAAEDAWSLDLRIPEDHVSDLERGMTGRFSSYARPETEHPLRIAQVQPNARLHEGANVYFADAQVELDSEWVRSGMEGLAVVEVDRRAPWKVLFHGVEAWLQLHLWL